MDLRGALATAETNNLELRAARQQRAIALAGLTTARQIPNPTLSFSAARDLPHESVIWDQPFELGGKRARRIDVARGEQGTTDLEITILSRQIRRKTREAFFRFLLSHAQTEQAQQALGLAAKLKNIVEQRFEVGDVARLEVVQADVELARAQAEADTAVQSERSSEVLLGALLGGTSDHPPLITGHLQDLPPPLTLLQASETAMASNPDLQRTNQEMQVEKSRLGLAKAQRIPNLDLQAGVDLNSPPDFNVGPRGQIGVNLPLFYHGQGEVAASSAKLEFLRLSLEAQKINATSQAAAAYYDYAAKRTQEEQYSQKIVPLTVRLVEMSEDSYRSGKSNLLTVIDAQRKLNEVRRTYLDSLFAAQSSFAAMEEVVGTPLD